MSYLNDRELGRALSSLADATMEEALTKFTGAELGSSSCRRIAVTGAPGAGKSTLVSRLLSCEAWLGKRVAVLAIDPSSPVSQGALLGDRFRLPEELNNANIFFRSFASRSASDGLMDNFPLILALLDSQNFDEIIIETVGLGQVDYSVADFVDAMVLVLHPESGDQIQAMKAGIMERADIFVINKADLPGSEALQGQLKELAALHALACTTQSATSALPAVVKTGPGPDFDIMDVHDALEALCQTQASDPDRKEALAMRARRHLQSVLRRQFEEALQELSQEELAGSMKQAYLKAVAKLG